MILLRNSFALFSLFFGAGNAVFPILLGLQEKEFVLSSFLGLFLSAILLPCLGLLAVLFYKGSLSRFFKPFGSTGTFIITGLMAGLLGPLAVMPRCIIVAHASLEGLGMNLSFTSFSLLFCLISFLCLWSRQRVMDLLGKFLSPLLLVSLLAIIFSADHDTSFRFSTNSFSRGFLVGYGTLDMLAALFFAPSVYLLMREKESLKSLVASSLLGFFFLAIVYLGLASAASSLSLDTSHPATLLREMSQIFLGRQGAYIACVAVALACLTTVVGLTVSLIQWALEGKETNKGKERVLAFFVLALCALFSFLGFEAIMNFLGMILTYLYPFLIAWTLFQFYRSL